MPLSSVCIGTCKMLSVHKSWNENHWNIWKSKFGVLWNCLKLHWNIFWGLITLRGKLRWNGKELFPQERKQWECMGVGTCKVLHAFCETVLSTHNGRTEGAQVWTSEFYKRNKCNPYTLSFNPNEQLKTKTNSHMLLLFCLMSMMSKYFWSIHSYRRFSLLPNTLPILRL